MVRRRGRKSKEERIMRKKNNGIRTLVTSAVLLVLVIAGAWTLKARNDCLFNVRTLG